MIKLIRDYDEFKNEIDQVYALLELDHSIDEFPEDGFSEYGNFAMDHASSIQIRPLYLSHNVEAPFSHHHELVTVTKTKFGDTFDWNETPAGRLFKVKTSSEKPENAYIATHYRDHWFYIEDTNLESKSTFMLLRQLFDLQAGQKQSTGPTLTLPVR